MYITLVHKLLFQYEENLNIKPVYQNIEEAN